MQVFLQNKGHHQPSAGAQMMQRPVNQRGKMAAAAAHKDRVGAFDADVRGFGCDHVDITAGKALAVFCQQTQRRRVAFNRRDRQRRMLQRGFNRHAAGPRADINQVAGPV